VPDLLFQTSSIRTGREETRHMPGIPAKLGGQGLQLSSCPGETSLKPGIPAGGGIITIWEDVPDF